MPNIIFINGRFLTQRITGVQRYAYEISRKLIENGISVKIIMPAKPIFEGYDTTGWPIVKYGTLGGHIWEQYSLPLYLFSTRRKVKNGILLNLCNTAPVLFGRNIVALHDISFVDQPQWFKRTFVLLYKFITPVIVRRSISIITVSQFSKERIETVYPSAKGKVEVIHSSCGRSSFAVEEGDSSGLEKYDLTKNNFILSVCSIEPRKNLAKLIEAFRELNHPNIQLVLVGGGGSAFTNVVLNTKDDHRIKSTGYIPEAELQSLYRNALCFCYPSLYEGFGLPPLEAMAKHCPVIVSGLPSLHEVCGDAALYVDPNDSSSIASAIDSLIKDHGLRSLLVQKGSENVKRFSWESTAAKALKVIHDLE